MIRITTRLTVFFLLALLWSVPAGADEVFRILVVVNGVPVTNIDFEQRLREMLVSVNKQMESQGRATLTLDDLRRQKEVTDRVMEQFVEEILLRQEIQRFELRVSDEELDQRIAAIQEREGLTLEKMNELLEQEGRTMEEFRAQLRQDILKHRLIQGTVGKKIVVTDTEIMEEYARQAGALEAGQLVRLAYILLPASQDAEEVVSAIEDGDMTFAEAAGEYSVGPGADEGGDLGYLDVGDLAPKWQEMLNGLDVGDVSEPFDVDGQTALIKLVDKEESEIKVDENRKEQIYQELREKKFQVTLDEYIQNLRERSLVQHLSDY